MNAPREKKRERLKSTPSAAQQVHKTRQDKASQEKTKREVCPALRIEKHHFVHSINGKFVASQPNPTPNNVSRVYELLYK